MLRTSTFLIAAGLYAVATTFLIAGSVRHYEQIALGLQFAVLLPALVWYLRRPKYFPSQLTYRPWAWQGQGHSLAPVALFLIMAIPFGYSIGRSIVFADESSYRFQAEAISLGKVKADPPPGAAERASETPDAVAFKHEVVSRHGWFSKYPIGWPAFLAIPERAGLGWLVNPALGLALLGIAGAIARETYGKAAISPSLWMLALSPYLLSYCTGRMSHGLCAVLVAGACWACLRGLRTERLWPFAVMLGCLVASFHVRPFTAFLMSVLFGFASLWNVRKNRRLLVKLCGLSVLAGIAAVASLLMYNYVFTGKCLVSPYALYDGTSTPRDVQLSAQVLVRNILETRRASMQTTLLWSFPFLFLLAGYGFWRDRTRPATWILGAMFPVIFLGHMSQPYGTAAIVGERYYFEAFFSVAILAAVGAAYLAAAWRINVNRLVLAGVVMAGVQLTLSAVAMRQITQVAQPNQEVASRAQSLQNCRCVVFLQSTSDFEFFNANLNLNRPDWRSSNVFFANDPGAGERAIWAERLGFPNWTLIRYDQRSRSAVVEPMSQGMVAHALNSSAIRDTVER